MQGYQQKVDLTFRAETLWAVSCLRARLPQPPRHSTFLPTSCEDRFRGAGVTASRQFAVRVWKTDLSSTRGGHASVSRHCSATAAPIIMGGVRRGASMGSHLDDPVAYVLRQSIGS